MIRLTKDGTIPYTSEHYTLDWCIGKAEELRQSGKYDIVRIGSRLKENSKSYAKIFVRVKGEQNGK